MKFKQLFSRDLRVQDCSSNCKIKRANIACANTVQPWHRSPWIWFMMGMIGMTMLASFITLYLAIKVPEHEVRSEFASQALDKKLKSTQNADVS